MTAQHASNSGSTRDTREKLLTSATRLFGKQGFAATSVKQIADDAEVNVSLVSYHFDGKEGLYRTCLQRFGQERMEATDRILQPPTSREEIRVRLQMFTEEVWRFHFENPDINCMVHRDEDIESMQGFEIIGPAFAKMFQTIVTFFSEAQKRKLFRKDVDPELASQFFLGSLMFPAIKDQMTERLFDCTLKDPQHRARMIKTLLQLFLDGFVLES
jgi:AcrR family transcriptional regulator